MQPPGLACLPSAPRETQPCTVPCPFLPSTGKQKGSQSHLQCEGFLGTGLMTLSELSLAQSKHPSLHRSPDLALSSILEGVKFGDLLVQSGEGTKIL